MLETWIDLPAGVIREDAVREKRSHARALPIVPVADMLEAGAEFNAQMVRYSPGIVQIERRILVGMSLTGDPLLSV